MDEAEEYRRKLAERLKGDDRLSVALPYGLRRMFADIESKATGRTVSVRFMDGEMRFWDFVDDGRNDGFGVPMSPQGLELLVKELYQVFSDGFTIVPRPGGAVAEEYFTAFYRGKSDKEISEELEAMLSEGSFGRYDSLEAANFFGDRAFKLKRVTD